MSDVYPSTDEEQTVQLVLDYPNVERDLNRWLPLVKWLLAIPHYIVLLFLCIAAVAALIVAWLAVLFTGRYPRAIFDFVEGVLRWGLRVEAYALFLYHRPLPTLLTPLTGWQTTVHHDLGHVPKRPFSLVLANRNADAG